MYGTANCYAITQPYMATMIHVLFMRQSLFFIVCRQKMNLGMRLTIIRTNARSIYATEKNYPDNI